MLGEDQESNLNLGPVTAFHVDEILNQKSNLNLGPVTAFHVDEILNDKKKQEEDIKMCLDSGWLW